MVKQVSRGYAGFSWLCRFLVVMQVSAVYPGSSRSFRSPRLSTSCHKTSFLATIRSIVVVHGVRLAVSVRSYHSFSYSDAMSFAALPNSSLCPVLSLSYFLSLLSVLNCSRVTPDALCYRLAPGCMLLMLSCR